MKKLLLLLLLLAAPAAAQQPVKQSGHVTPGHLTQWLTNGTIKDAGTALNGFLTSVGVIAAGPGICQSSGPATGPYNQICLSVTTGSPSQIIMGNFGGAVAQPLNFVINGATYSFPFTGPGTGVIGPVSSTVSDVACWNSTIGAALSDCGPGVGGSFSFTNTPTNNQVAVGSGPTTAHWQPVSTWFDSVFCNTAGSFISRSGSSWGCINVALRTGLVADTAYYVNTSTGNDSNPGTVTLPFKTLNYAWSHLANTLDPAGHIVTINVAAGSYPLQIATANKFISGEVHILGAGSSSTTIVDFDLEGNHPVLIDIDNVTFKDDGGSLHNASFFTNGVASFGLGFTGGNDLVFDTTANSGSFGINPTSGTVIFLNSFTAKGNAKQLINPADQTTNIDISGTVTLFGSPSYSVGLVQAIQGGVAGIGPITGSFSGPKYQIGGNGSSLFSLNSIPGTIEGQVFASSEYDGPDTNVIFTPLTSATVNMVNLRAIIKPAGTISTLTVNLPNTTTVPLGINFFQDNNQVVTISTSQIITTLTLATVDGSAIATGGGGFTLGAGTSVRLIYNNTDNTWYPD